MPDDSDSDHSESLLLCAPLKKSKALTSVLGNCNDSVVCSTQRSSISVGKTRLSLSQRKRQFSTPSKADNSRDDFSEDDDIIPASQKYLKPSRNHSSDTHSGSKKAKLDFCLEDSEPELLKPKSPHVYDDIRLSPNPANQSSSSTVKASGFPPNRASFLLDDVTPAETVASQNHSSSNEKQDELDENSNKASQSTILSFDLTPKPRQSISALDTSMASEERALRLLQTSFSASGSSKQDFIRHWVDSCPLEEGVGPMETQDLFVDQKAETSQLTLSSGSETLPLIIRSDPLVLEMSSDDKLPHQTPEKQTQTIDEEEPVPSTSGVVSTCTASQTMITPTKQSTTNQRNSTGSSKQSMLTDFFTPCAKTPAKAVPVGSVAQLQMRTCISELKDSADDEMSYTEIISETTMSTKSNATEAKAQWSQLMSKMRGSAKNLKREMKQFAKRRPNTRPAAEQPKAEESEPAPASDQRRCPFYKRIPDTNFAIDAFDYGRIPGVTSYFLSHFHYDHYRGLGRWLDKPLYCSQVTANLIQLKIKLPSHLVRVVPLNESRIVENIEVVLVDANHCPGAVMFLFRFPTGRCVLHVGDFRAHESMAGVRELTRSPITELYLDTTYCDPNYDFPSQDDVVAYVRRLVRKNVERHPKLLVVSGTYTIGKEKVFMAAADELDCKIWAPVGKRAVLNCIEDPALHGRLVANPDDARARVHVANMADVNPRNLKNYLDAYNGRFTHVLALNPTGWEYDTRTAIKGLDGIQPKVHYGCVFIYGVPYSEHSGYTEMKRFVQLFKPAKIVPTVNVGSAQQRRKMEATFDEWLGRRRRL